MLGRLSIDTPPTGYPVSLDLVKQHTRIAVSDDDVLLPLYIATATELVEAYLNRALLTQTLNWAVADSFPVNSWPLVPAPILILPIASEYNYTHLMRRDIELPRSPVQTVNFVNYALWGDSMPTTLDTTDYDVDPSCDPTRVRLHSDVPWSDRQYVLVNYTTGYGAAADVPLTIVHALLLIVAWLYEHRGDVDSGDLPPAARSLLANYRLTTFW